VAADRTTRPGRVYVVGSLNEDLVLTVEQLPKPGETILGRLNGRACGGKGANQAVAAARAGASVRMVGCVGSDEAGSRLVRALAAEGIDTSGVSRLDGPSGLAVVSVAGDGENAIIVTEGANAHCSPDLIHAALADLSPGDVVVAQGEIPLDSVEAAATRTRAALARFVLNLAPPLDVDPRRAPVDLLVVNEHEALTLARRGGYLDTAVQVVAVELSRLWDAAVVVTLGAAGALYTVDGSVEHMPPFPAEQVTDTTGAGDAFVGAMAAALAQEMPTRAAVSWGLAAGAIAVAAEGAQGGAATAERITQLVGGGASAGTSADRAGR
jgi:ribokinase